MNLVKKKPILIIISAVILAFYVIYYDASFIAQETNIFKTPIQITGIVKRGWHTNPVSANYLEVANGMIYYLDDRAKKHEPFDCTSDTIESCYEGKKIKVEGHLTRQRIEIIIDQKKNIQAQVLEVGSARME